MSLSSSNLNDILDESTVKIVDDYCEKTTEETCAGCKSESYIMYTTSILHDCLIPVKYNIDKFAKETLKHGRESGEILNKFRSN